MTLTLQQILENEPKIVKHFHRENGLNICDECENYAREDLWVWFNPDMQICLDCFFRISGGINQVSIKVIKRAKQPKRSERR